MDLAINLMRTLGIKRCINSRLKKVLPEKGATKTLEELAETARAQEAANRKQDEWTLKLSLEQKQQLRSVTILSRPKARPGEERAIGFHCDEQNHYMHAITSVLLSKEVPQVFSRKG